MRGAASFIRAAAAILCALPLAASAAPPATRDDVRAGWHFHFDPPAEEEPPKATAPLRPPAPPAAPARPAELVAFEQMQKKMADLRNIAIMHPTQANVRAYMTYELMVVEKAALFAETARQLGLRDPVLDPTTRGRPVTTAGQRAYDERATAAANERIKTLGKDHVLMFFFRSDCPYCHAMAPTVAKLGRDFGIKVEAVSIDGAGLQDFPAPRRDNGIASKLGATQVPALFLAQPYRGNIMSVSVGVKSYYGLIEKLGELTDPSALAGDSMAEFKSLK